MLPTPPDDDLPHARHGYGALAVLLTLLALLVISTEPLIIGAPVDVVLLWNTRTCIRKALS